MAKQSKKTISVSYDELEAVKKEIAKLSPEEKDHLLALYRVAMNKALRLVEKGEREKLSRKEEREIEHALSLGPAWLNYSFRSTKTNKRRSDSKTKKKK